MNEEVQQSVKELMTLFPRSFINAQQELILVPGRANLYFRLEDVDSVETLCCKLIEWCSRAACKSEPYDQSIRNEMYQTKVRNNLNTFLGVDFDIEQWREIYTRLGNGCNRELCRAFVQSDFDLSLLKKEGMKKQ